MEATEQLYYQVNREERHFGCLLAAAIIYEENFRKFFFELVNKKFKNFLDVNKEFDIYVEVAILRDFWFALGDVEGINYEKYKQNVHSKREDTIKKFLECFDTHLDINEEKLFWTKNPQTSILWYPGHWNENLIEQANAQKEILKRIKWACNAKPDLLLISGNNGLVIELKLESEKGKNKKGYVQEKTQDDIIKIIKGTIPAYKNYKFKRIVLDKKGSNGISWTDLNGYEFDNELVKKHLSNMPK
jgi:hypothetical protein